MVQLPHCIGAIPELGPISTAELGEGSATKENGRSNKKITSEDEVVLNVDLNGEKELLGK